VEAGPDALEGALDAVVGKVASAASLGLAGAAVTREECGRNWYQK
jgi:hypothetical protein